MNNWLASMKLKPNKMQQTLGFRVREPVDWEEVKGLLDQLYAASGRLEALFPGRKFTLDGHLVGSVGEVIAAYMFDLDLARASSQGHDAFAPDRRQVEIKLTQGNSVAIRHEPEHLVVLQRPKAGPMSAASFPAPAAAATTTSYASSATPRKTKTISPPPGIPEAEFAGSAGLACGAGEGLPSR